MASSTQTRKIHAPIGLWILMVIIVRAAGNFEVLALASLQSVIEVVDSQELEHSIGENTHSEMLVLRKKPNSILVYTS